MFPGHKIKIDDEELVIPALSLGQLRGGVIQTLEEHDKLLAEGKTFDVTLKRGEIILEALRRNYPNYPAEKLFNFLDMQNTREIWLVVLGASGFNMGETPAATTEVSGT